eukprot:TRINITY_DN19239_c0_g1_i1.p1 TRINITY_DN19239_c0_g1~~TRINITY_DN19239_c0_g1_i1.p1  ORF type:complete len:256 (+),score=15.90 TRINITY_DN19239_c0_g1_i1:216-983(+)
MIGRSPRSDSVDGDAEARNVGCMVLDGSGPDCVDWYPNARKYRRSEILADALVLLVGCCFSVVASPLLVHKSVSRGDEDLKIAGLAVYVICMSAMLNLSFLFNTLAWNEKLFSTLQFLDMCGIYLMFAGTYTPLCLQSNCMLLLKIQWSLVFVGVAWQVWNFGVPDRLRYPVDLFILLPMCWSVMCFRDDVFPYLSTWGVQVVVGSLILVTMSEGLACERSGRHVHDVCGGVLRARRRPSSGRGSQNLGRWCRCW